MDIHKNARLSFRSRESLARFCDRAGGPTRKAAAAAFRVSAKTAAKWIVRFPRRWPRWIGRTAVPRPHRRPAPFCPTVLAHPRRSSLRCQRLPGYLIAHRTGLSPASVSRILRRAPASADGRDLDPPPPVQRYERETPGELLTASRYQKA